MAEFEEGGLPNGAPPIHRKVLRDYIREYLMENILSGKIPAGERLVESRLAKQLGVSQAPVREAIRELEQMGLLESTPFRGSAVRNVSREDIAEVYPVRALLEGMAARIVCRKHDPEVITKLEEAMRDMRETALKGDRGSMILSDIEFHETIIKAAGNKFLLRLWSTVKMANWTYITTKLSGDRLEELAGRHGEVLAAIASGNEDLAEATMRKHIEELPRYMVR